MNNNEDPTADRIYSEYIKDHAYKLLVITSHGISNIDNDTTNKYTLWIQISSGNTSESTMQQVTMGTLINHNYLIKEAGLLGDHAFHNSYLVISPYSQTQIQS